MSIYNNPIYGNPTTVPYTKLKEEDKPQLLQNLITLPEDSPRQLNYKRQHRIVSACSCILCSLVLILVILGSILVVFNVFERCFRTEDIDSEGFEQFMRIFQPRKQLKLEDEQSRPFFGGRSRQRIMPFPKGPFQLPGPVVSSSVKKIGEHAQCPVMNLIECNRNSFDGYSLKEHQERVDLNMGKAMLNGRLNSSYAVNKARIAFKICVKDYEAEKKSIIRNFAKQLIEIKDFELKNQDSSTLFANITAHTRLQFGVDTLFNIEVGPNYLSPDGQRPYIMYFGQREFPSINSGQFILMRNAFKSAQLNESDYQKLVLNVPRIQEMTVDSDDSINWKSFTAAEARARWPFFDFTNYLSHLNTQKRFSHNVKEFIFVVKTPAYFDKLNAFLLPKTKNDAQEKIDLFKLLSIYIVFADFGKYLGIDSVESEMQKRYQIGNNPASPIAHPYHFIYTYDKGHATYGAIKFCAADLRHHLPHIASALHADITSNFPIHTEIQRFEELIEVTREELIQWLNESDVEQELKDILVEKLRKTGISFTTRESLQKDSFEEAHRQLNLDGQKHYIDGVVEMKNFLFKRKLDRINSKIEALRSSAFAEASAANVDLEYSHLGNWLNVPAAILTSPMLATEFDSPKTMVYSNLIWILGRELSKAIDSEGALYNALGVHKRGETDLKKLELMWTEAHTCLEQNIHNSQGNHAIIVRRSLNEIIGFQMAYRSFEKAVERILGGEEGRRSKDDLKTTSIQNFFMTSTAVYCETEKKRGGSMALLDKFVDTFLKKHNILGCTKQFVNSECIVRPRKQ